MTQKIIVIVIGMLTCALLLAMSACTKTPTVDPAAAAHDLRDRRQVISGERGGDVHRRRPFTDPPRVLQRLVERALARVAAQAMLALQLVAGVGQPRDRRERLRRAANVLVGQLLPPPASAAPFDRDRRLVGVGSGRLGR